MVEPGKNQSKKKEIAFAHLNNPKEIEQDAQLNFFDKIFIKLSKIKASTDDKEYLGAYKQGWSKVVSHKLRIILSIFVLLLVIVGGVFVPDIPLLLQRNSVMQAVENEDYDVAIDTLQEYLEEKPNDFKTSMLGIRVAMIVGDIDYAKKLIKQNYSSKNLKKDPSLGFFHALTSFDDPIKIINQLNEVLKNIPDHIASRVLRGYLSRQNSDLRRQSREDFNKAYDALYSSEEGVSSLDLQIMHNWFVENKNIDINLGTVSETFYLNEKFVLEHLLGFNPAQSIFELDFRLSFSDTVSDNLIHLTNTAIINFYFAIVLIEQKQFDEAETHISEIRSLISQDRYIFGVTQLEGLLAVARGRWLEAVKIFKKIDDAQITPDLQIKANLAAAMINSSEFDLADILTIYQNMLDIESNNFTAIINSTYLNLLNKDVRKAINVIELTDAIEESKIKLLWGIIRFLEKDYIRAHQNFSSVQEDDYKEIKFFIGATLVQQGRYEEALGYYWDISLEERDASFRKVVVLSRVRLLHRLNDWESSYHFLKNKESADFTNPLDYHYLRGLAAINVGNLTDAKEQLNVLKKNIAVAPFYFHALKGRYGSKEGSKSKALRSYFSAIKVAPSAWVAQEYVIEVLSFLDKYKEEHIKSGGVDRYNQHFNNIFLAVEGYVTGLFYDPQIAVFVANTLVETDPRRALSLIETATGINQSYIVRRSAAETYWQLDNFSQAIAVFEQAREWNPTDTNLLENLKIAYQSVNNDKKVQDIEQTINLIKAYKDGAIFEGIDYNEEKLAMHIPKLAGGNTDLLVKSITEITKNKNQYQIKEVHQLYKSLVKKASTTKKAEVLYSYALFNVLTGNKSKAFGIFDQALAIGLSSEQLQIEVMRTYIQHLVKERRFIKAIELLEQIRDIDDDISFYYIMKATVYRDRGETVKAVELLKDYLKQNPYSKVANRNLVESYIKISDYSSAEYYARRNARIFNKNSDSHDLLAEVYEAAGYKLRSRMHKNISLDAFNKQ